MRSSDLWLDGGSCSEGIGVVGHYAIILNFERYLKNVKRIVRILIRNTRERYLILIVANLIASSRTLKERDRLKTGLNCARNHAKSRSLEFLSALSIALIKSFESY